MISRVDLGPPDPFLCRPPSMSNCCRRLQPGDVDNREFSRFRRTRVGVHVTRAAMTELDRQRQLFPFGLVSAHVGILALCTVSHPLMLAEIQATFWVVAGVGVAVVAIEAGSGTN